MRTAPIALLSTAAVATLLPATVFGTPEIGQKHNGLSLCDERYLVLYQQAHDAGLDVGRNRVDDGKLLASGEVILEPHPCQLGRRIAAMLHPPAPAPGPAGPVVEMTTAAVPASAAPTGTGWDAVAACESSGDWSANPGNGYYGGLQFDSATWDRYGDDQYAEASDAPPEAQIDAAESMPYDGW